MMFMNYCIGGNFARRNFSPISPSALGGEIFIHEFLSCIDDCIEDMAFTALTKIYSIEYFCNTKAAGLGKFLSSKKFQLYSTFNIFTIRPRFNAHLTSSCHDRS